jgi:Uma2 family endonuclease
MATGASWTVQKTTERFLLYNVPWEGYQSFLQVLAESAVRLTYNQGTLELMRGSFLRERYKVLVARIVNVLTEERETGVVAMGSTTFNREALECGVDPDLSYYFSNAGKITDWDRINLDVDPPPDLVVEIGLTNEARGRLRIFAALKAPEVWRFDGERLEVLKFQAAGDYQVIPQSEIFPWVSMEGVARFLRDSSIGDDNRWAKAFRRWVRETVAPGVQDER